MRTIAWLLPVGCFALAILILIFADGAKRFYSGLFFVILGLALLANARRRREAPEDR